MSALIKYCAYQINKNQLTEQDAIELVGMNNVQKLLEAVVELNEKTPSERAKEAKIEPSYVETRANMETRPAGFSAQGISRSQYQPTARDTQIENAALEASIRDLLDPTSESHNYIDSADRGMFNSQSHALNVAVDRATSEYAGAPGYQLYRLDTAFRMLNKNRTAHDHIAGVDKTMMLRHLGALMNYHLSRGSQDPIAMRDYH